MFRWILGCLGMGCFLSPVLFSATLDTLRWGDEISEKEHALRYEAGVSEVRAGAMGETCRVLLPPQTQAWQGGSLFFTLKVRPTGDMYLSFRFWGGEDSPNMLVLFVDGKQLGYRHLGDYDILHHGGEGPCPGKFYWITTVLPERLTAGKSRITFELRLSGRIWSYGEHFEQFQKAVEGPSLGFYEATTHTEAFLPFAGKSEKRAWPVRPAAGREVLERVIARVNRELEARLTRTTALTLQDVEYLARGYVQDGTVAYRDARVPEKVLEAGDAYLEAAAERPELLFRDPRQYNNDWFGIAPLGEAVTLVYDAAFQKRLDERLENGRTRRAVWADAFCKSVENLTRNRRVYTNQSMIIDWNIYRMNRALRLLDAEKALPESRVVRYLQEAMGCVPWHGRETDAGPELPYGEGFYETTRVGLTRELGYVGSYGEVLDWAAWICLACPDVSLREQLRKMAKARLYFRYPAPDAEGFRAMRLETVIGWRDVAYLGPVVYGARTGKEGDASLVARVADDAVARNAFRRQLAENQYWPMVERLLEDGSLRVSNVLLGIPGNLAALEKQMAEESSGEVFPMADGAADFTFRDPENGVLAMKRGEERLYVSFYWRARYGINRLAKIHYITPDCEWMATVRCDVAFFPEGTEYTRPDWTIFAFRPTWGVHYPERFTSLHAGEVLPVAKLPDFLREEMRAKENHWAGRAEEYSVTFGKYQLRMGR
ncbi:MAG: hypothetical protein Q4D98_00090 [Planctomycetia bacterium]|nr:hypothetical protein [Planctomycetia bacterium]